MLNKLESKLKREVQNRIENQRKLHQNLHDTGARLERTLLQNFDQEIHQISLKVEDLKQSLDNWEPQLLRDLSDNRQRMRAFDDDCQQVLTNMRLSLQTQYVRTEALDQKVLDRNSEFEERVFETPKGSTQISLNTLEKERDQYERELTKRILEFNTQVMDDACRIEEMAKAEVQAIREEIDRESFERRMNDQALLDGVKQFLNKLHKGDIQKVVRIDESHLEMANQDRNHKRNDNTSQISQPGALGASTAPDVSDKYQKTIGLLGKIFKRDNNKDLTEMMESFEENKEEILQTFKQQSFKNEEGSKALIKMSELSSFIKKLEEVMGYELDQLQEYILKLFSLKLTKYAISADDLLLALQHYIEYTKFVRENPTYLKTEGSASQEEFLSLSSLQAAENLTTTFGTAYTIKTRDPREPVRIKSLQVLCFKLATHNTKILKLLDRYIDNGEQVLDEGQIEDANKNVNSNQKIPLSKLSEVLKDFSLITGLILIQYNNLSQAETQTDNDPYAVSKFEQFFYLNLSIGDGLMRKPSLFRQKTAAQKVKQVKFLEDGIQYAKDVGLGFTKQFFMYQIDKFFSKELNIVLHCMDDEYDKFLLSEKKEEEEFQKQLDDLDDYFLAKSEPDSQINVRERDVMAEQVIYGAGVKKSKTMIIDEGDSQESQSFKQHLSQTIQEYEVIMSQNQFKNPQEKREMQNLLDLLKAQLNTMDKKQTSRKETLKSDKEDINEARKRGLQEIFHFYSRQHIPLNREFDDLKEIMTEVDLGEYTKFCSDFSIPLTKAKLTEVFKKCSLNHKPHKFEQFYGSMSRLAQEINKNQIEEINMKIKQLNLQIRKQQTQKRYQEVKIATESLVNESQLYKDSQFESRQEDESPDKKSSCQQADNENSRLDESTNEIQQDQNNSQLLEENAEAAKQEYSNQPIDYSNFQSVNLVNESQIIEEQVPQRVESSVINDKIQQEKLVLEAKKRELEIKSEEEFRDQMLAFLECHDANKYRKKIKGFHMAFNIREKDDNQGPLTAQLSQRNQHKAKQSAEEIRKQAQELKNKRIYDKAMKEKESQEKYGKDREVLRKMHEQLRKQRALAIDPNTNSAPQGNVAGNRYDDKALKITFGAIENMHYTDFNQGKVDDFKPSDIVDDDYNSSEDEVLKKFKQEQLQAPENRRNKMQAGNVIFSTTEDKNTLSTINTDTTAAKIKVQTNSQLQDIYQIQPPKNILQGSNQIKPLQHQIKNLKSSIDRLNLMGPLTQRQPQGTKYLGQNQSNPQFDVSTPESNRNRLPQKHHQINMSLMNPLSVRDSMQLDNRPSIKKRGGQQVNQSELTSQRLKQSLITDRATYNNVINNSNRALPEISPVRKIMNTQTNNTNMGNLNQSINYGDTPVMQQVGLKPQFNKVSQSLDTSAFRQVPTQPQYMKNSIALKNPNNNLSLGTIGKDQVSLQSQNLSGINRYQKQVPSQIIINSNAGNTGYNQMIPMKNDSTISGKDNINRAYQIDQMNKQRLEANKNNILKMTDQQIKKGMNAVRKGQ